MMAFGMGWGMIWILVFWLLVLGGSIALIAALFPRAGGRDDRNNQDPLTILKQRYARGELSNEEFEAIHAGLKEQ